MTAELIQLSQFKSDFGSCVLNDINLMRISLNQEVGMSLCDQLKQIIDDYFVKYPYTSVNGLAKKSKVGASTLRRIIGGNIKGDPAPHTVLNIASAITKEKKLVNLIEMFDGPIGEMLRENFGPYLDKQAEHVYSHDLNQALKDRISYFIYKLSSNRTGVSQWEVAELFGETGIRKMEKMIEFDLLKQEGDKYHAKEKNFSLDLEIARDHLPELVSFYKPENLAEGKNLFYSLSESINEDGIKKIKEIQKEAVLKIYDVMRSPFYEGEIPFFSVNLCDTLSFSSQPAVLQ